MSSRERIVAVGIIVLVAVGLALLYPLVGLWAVGGAALTLLGLTVSLRRSAPRRSAPRSRPELVAEAQVAVPNLSDVEVAVLKLLATGANRREIAAELDLPEDDVREHVRSILNQLPLHRRLGAAISATA